MLIFVGVNLLKARSWTQGLRSLSVAELQFHTEAEGRRQHNGHRDESGDCSSTWEIFEDVEVEMWAVDPTLR